MPKSRLDRLVQERGLAPTREKAQSLILAGQILVNGQKVDKPGANVAPDAALARLGEAPRFVSRAGAKLEAALEHFSIDVRGRVCLDIGSSTGGFTDCLLQRGAARVHAIDSGTNQMDWRLRNDPRVHLRERTNARLLSASDIGEVVDFICIDVSFISVTLLLPAVLPLLPARGDLVILVKPQFEAGRAHVGKGGIVRDELARQNAIERVRSAVAAAGLERLAVIASPVLGAEGNQEYLLHATKPPAGAPPSDLMDCANRGIIFEMAEPAREATQKQTPTVIACDRVAIFCKPNMPEVSAVAPGLARWLEQRGYKVALESNAGELEPDGRGAWTGEPPCLAIVLGGDGTLLRAARALRGTRTPILGVNLGTLGFLTEVAIPELYSYLEAIFAQRCQYEMRSVAAAEVFRADQSIARFDALNDVVVTKGSLARIIEFSVDIDGDRVATYRADGVIVATPTGSTAYSLSAGGPVLHPALDAFLVTPICAHALTHRPIVVRDTSDIEITMRAVAEQTFLTIDGQQGQHLLAGDRILCRKSPDSVRLVRLPRRSFFDVLRNKLKWG